MKIQKILIACLLIVFMIGCKTGQQAKTETQSQSSTSSDSSSEFSELLSNKAKLQWKITYDINAEMEGQKSSYSMTQYVKGTKLRIDSAAGGYETRTYFADNVFTSCSQQGNNWNCIKISAPQDNTKDIENNIEADTGNYNILSDGSKTVAGTSAKCYKVTDAKNTFTLRECFSNKGIPLYFQMTGDKFVTETVATSFSESVSDADFEIPAGAKTQEMPAQGEGIDPCSGCNYLSGEEKEQCIANCGG